MTFRGWLIKKHLKTKGPIGDLARDIKDDKDFPKKCNDGQKIKDYLYDCGACQGCLDAFSDAWKEYGSEISGE